jgi:hypothetical protein
MTMSQSLDLTGLRGDHPLGFLTACGLLHSCKGAAGLGETRLAWRRSDKAGAFIAVLHTERPSDVACLSTIIDQRCAAMRESPAFKWSSKIDDRQKYRQAACALLAQNDVSPADKEALAVFTALTSDLTTNGKGSLRSTLLDLTSGNQRFLKSIVDLSEQISEEAVREALLGPWQYRDIRRHSACMRFETSYLKKTNPIDLSVPQCSSPRRRYPFFRASSVAAGSGRPASTETRMKTGSPGQSGVLPFRSTRSAPCSLIPSRGS